MITTSKKSWEFYSREKNTSGHKEYYMPAHEHTPFLTNTQGGSWGNDFQLNC
jgi:hypothetical protein